MDNWKRKRVHTIGGCWGCDILRNVCMIGARLQFMRVWGRTKEIARTNAEVTADVPWMFLPPDLLKIQLRGSHKSPPSKYIYDNHKMLAETCVIRLSVSYSQVRKETLNSRVHMTLVERFDIENWSKETSGAGYSKSCIIIVRLRWTHVEESRTVLCNAFAYINITST